MTYAEALTVPAVFGDERSILARDTIAVVNELFIVAAECKRRWRPGDANKSCRRCFGDGEHECSCGNIHSCESCGGIGRDRKTEALFVVGSKAAWELSEARKRLAQLREVFPVEESVA